ncbi:MAG TPA: hypothetical protein VF268_10575 [Gammaproteobacteria bacterium]
MGFRWKYFFIALFLLAGFVLLIVNLFQVIEKKSGGDAPFSDFSSEKPVKALGEAKSSNNRADQTSRSNSDLLAKYAGLYAQETIDIQENVDLLDQGLVSDNELAKFYAVSILRKAALSDKRTVSEYLEEKTRKDAVYKALNAEEFDTRVSAFGLLASVDISDPNTVAELASALKNENEKQLEMVRELGAKKGDLKKELKLALVNEILAFKAGGSQAGAVVEMIFLLSQVEAEGGENSIFPHVCELYKAQFYESPVMLRSFENFGRSAASCVGALREVADGLKNGSVKLKQPQHKDWLIGKTHSVLGQLEKG